METRIRQKPEITNWRAKFIRSTVKTVHLLRYKKNKKIKNLLLSSVLSHSLTLHKYEAFTSSWFWRPKWAALIDFWTYWTCWSSTESPTSRPLTHYRTVCKRFNSSFWRLTASSRPNRTTTIPFSGPSSSPHRISSPPRPLCRRTHLTTRRPRSVVFGISLFQVFLRDWKQCS